MRKSKKSERKTIILLVAVLLFMAVGFALYSTTLNIGGGASGTSSKAVFKNAWNVHYKSGTLQESGTADVAQSSSLTNTDFTFNVTLNKPGDTYVAKWKVVNDGTIKAKLTTINFSGLTADQQKFAECKLTYDGADYTTNATGLSNVINENGATKDVTLTITYKNKEDIPQADLPTEDKTITINGSFLYEDVA